MVLVIFVSPRFVEAEYGDIILNSKAKTMRDAGVNDVLFPHWFHRIFFKCKVCHESIFTMKTGANDIEMSRIINGEQCGVCHNENIAWGPLNCESCHSHEPGWLPGPLQKSRKIKQE